MVIQALSFSKLKVLSKYSYLCASAYPKTAAYFSGRCGKTKGRFRDLANP